MGREVGFGACVVVDGVAEMVDGDGVVVVLVVEVVVVVVDVVDVVGCIVVVDDIGRIVVNGLCVVVVGEAVVVLDDKLTTELSVVESGFIDTIVDDGFDSFSVTEIGSGSGT